jgi:membrane fusion protein (multidrug efflux system)
MFLRLLLILLMLAGLVGGLAYLKYEQVMAEIAQFSQPMPPTAVSAVEVGTASWQPRLNAVGSVRAVQGVLVNTAVPGQVRSIRFESGDRVSAGQPLVQLDTAVDEAELDGLRATLELAETKLKRNTSLLRDRAVSQGDFDETNAQLTLARAALASKQAFIEKKTIRAPFDGILGIRQIDLGQYLPEGSAIARLEALDPVFVDYALPERHLAKLAVGQSVAVRVDAYPGQVFEGRVRAVSPAVDVGTRNVRIRAELANPDTSLRPGMFAKVQTLLPMREQVLTLPRRAVSFNTYGDSVFAIEESMGDAANSADGPAQDTAPEAGSSEPQLTVIRRQIVTGAVRGDEVEIVEGLDAGDLVVLAGHQKLRNGAAVQIVPDDGGAASDAEGLDAADAAAGTDGAAVALSKPTDGASI